MNKKTSEFMLRHIACNE